MSPEALATAIRDAFWALKSKRIRVSPCHTTRASSLGNECERALYYERTANEMRTPPPPDLQAIFDLGNHLEDFVLREMEESGFKVTNRSRDYQDRKLELTGHVDAMLWREGWEKDVPVEVKGLNPYTASEIQTVEDIKSHPQSWVRKYYAQLQAYLFLGGFELGAFLLLDKVSGQILPVACPLDYSFAEALLQRAERVRDAVRAGEAPPRHQTEDCLRCPFMHVCGPDMQFGSPVEFFDSAEVEAMLRRRAELEPLRKEFEALDKAVKKAVPRKPELLCGDFALTGKEVERAGYTVEPTKFWQWTIKRLGNFGDTLKKSSLGGE